MMINYIEKGDGMHQSIAAAGFYLAQNGGGFMSDNDVAVQAIIDSYSLSDAQNYIAAKIDIHAMSLRNKAVAGISPAEIGSWTIKRSEAMAFIASGNPLDAPVLSIEAATRLVPLSNIVSRVLAAATALSGLEATIAGVSGRHKDAVRATTDFSSALAYDWLVGWPNV